MVREVHTIVSSSSGERASLGVCGMAGRSAREECGNVASKVLESGLFDLKSSYRRRLEFVQQQPHQQQQLQQQQQQQRPLQQVQSLSADQLDVTKQLDTCPPNTELDTCLPKPKLDTCPPNAELDTDQLTRPLPTCSHDSALNYNNSNACETSDSLYWSVTPRGL